VAGGHDTQEPAPLRQAGGCGPDRAGFLRCRGLGALLRMASYAERAGCEFRLASPRPLVVKIMRITGLDRRFLASETACRAGC
jgi:hypothetical protein